MAQGSDAACCRDANRAKLPQYACVLSEVELCTGAILFEAVWDQCCGNNIGLSTYCLGIWPLRVILGGIALEPLMLISTRPPQAKVL